MARALRFLIPLAVLSTSAVVVAQHASHVQESVPADPRYWQELMKSMDRMEAAMLNGKPSADCDTDFAALMLPHHQAAIDMARIELTFGKDPQLRRLAQEIVTDQASEIQLMQLWQQHRKER